MKTIDSLYFSFRDLERQVDTLRNRIYEHNRVILGREPTLQGDLLTRVEMRSRVDRIKIEAEKMMENLPSDMKQSPS